MPWRPSATFVPMALDPVIPTDIEESSMASFHPRKRTEWCVSSAAQPARNRVFKSEPAARKYAAELQAAGLAGVRATARVTTASASAQSLQSSPRSSSASANPASPALAKVGRTSSNGGRKDRVWAVADWVVAWMQLPQNEEQALMRACRYPHWFQPVKADVSAERLREREWRAARAPHVKARDRRNGRLWAMVSFSVQTAMRRGEMLKLRWEYVHLDGGYLDLPGSITKNSKPRLVPLTLRALRILRSQPRNSECVFPISLTKALLARFPKSAAVTPSGPLTARWMQETPTDNRLLAAWALDFCKIRNSAAHGSGQRGAQRLVWDHDRHLAFASILFPLVVKKVLAERTLYVPTERDRDEFDHIEDFLANDPFGPEVRPRQSPWGEVQSKIRGLGFGRSLHTEILGALGIHGESPDADHAP